MPKLMMRIAAVIAGVVLVLAAVAWLALRASLPVLDGRLVTRALAERVTLERDALGVVTVSGGSRGDVAFGLGYAHGQDRFFEMDLMRRAAAGELSALLGSRTLATDRELRLHRFRAEAHALVAAAPADHRLARPSRRLLEQRIDVLATTRNKALLRGGREFLEPDSFGSGHIQWLVEAGHVPRDDKIGELAVRPVGAPVGAQFLHQLRPSDVNCVRWRVVGGGGFQIAITRRARQCSHISIRRSPLMKVR